MGSPRGRPQTQLWRLAAAMGPNVSITHDERGHIQVGGLSAERYQWAQACAPHPWGLVVGTVNITKSDWGYNGTCNSCTLANCVRGVASGTQVLVVQQPALMMSPVSASGRGVMTRGSSCGERQSMFSATEAPARRSPDSGHRRPRLPHGHGCQRGRGPHDRGADGPWVSQLSKPVSTA